MKTKTKLIIALLATMATVTAIAQFGTTTIRLIDTIKNNTATDITLNPDNDVIVNSLTASRLLYSGASKELTSATNATINASDELSGLALLDVDNLRLDGNTMSSTDTNGNLIFDADGTGEIQANDNFDIRSQGDLKLSDSTNTNYIALQAPSSVTTSTTFTLPDGDGTSGQVIVTDGAGALSWSSSAGGSGTGSVNYIDNPSAEDDLTGWSEFNDGVSLVDGTGGTADITLSRNTTSPLRESADFQLAKDAADRSNQGFSYDFTLDPADEAKILYVTFDFDGTNANYADDDLSVHIYDRDNSELIDVTPFEIKAGLGKFVGFFQTPSCATFTNCDDMRLIININSTNATAYDVFFDNFIVGPPQAFVAPNSTDWEEFTPTGSWTTNTTYDGFYKRIGDSLLMNVFVSLSGAPNSTVFTLNPPNNLEIDTAKLPTSGSSNAGWAFLYDSTAANRVYGQPYVASSTTISIIATGNSGVSDTIPFTWGSGDSIRISVLVPIAGWGEPQTVSEIDASRKVSFLAHNGDTNITGVNPNNSYVQITGLDDTSETNLIGDDSHNGHSGGVYTFQKSGRYKVGFNLQLSSTNISNGDLYIVALRLGDSSSTFSTATQITQDISYATTGQTQEFHSKIPVSVSKGDKLYIGLFSSANHSVSTLTISGNTERSHFYAYEDTGTTFSNISARYTAKYRNGTSNTLVNSAIVDFGSKVFDDGGFGTVTTGASWRFTASEAGRVKISAKVGAVSLSGNYDEGEITSLRVYKNGVEEDYLDRDEARSSPSTSVLIPLSGDTIIDMSPGDYFDLRYFHNIGVNPELSGNANDTSITIERIK